MTTKPSKTAKTAVTPTKKHHDMAEDPAAPSQSRWGVEQSSMAEGGVDIGSLSPGKSGGANLS
jgi:hypothetical protein